jgi:hypothetical protein
MTKLDWSRVTMAGFLGAALYRVLMWLWQHIDVRWVP